MSCKKRYKVYLKANFSKSLTLLTSKSIISYRKKQQTQCKRKKSNKGFYKRAACNQDKLKVTKLIKMDINKPTLKSWMPYSNQLVNNNKSKQNNNVSKRKRSRKKMLQKDKLKQHSNKKQKKQLLPKAKAMLLAQLIFRLNLATLVLTS